MKPTLIIGYGNPLRGDDGVGWLAAERLATCAAADGLIVAPCHQLMPELAEPISQAGLVVFIDAREGGPAGSWNCAAIAPDATAPASITHHFDPPTLLAYARALFGCCPPAVVISVAAQSFECGVALSAPVKTAMAQVIGYVRGLAVRPAELTEAVIAS